MAGETRTVAGLLIMAATCWATQASAQTLPVVVGVRLVNEAAVDRGTVGNAKEVVTRLFAESSVELVWAGNPSGVRAPELWLTVALIGSRRVNSKLASGVLGVALLPGFRRGWRAYVLWDRIASVASHDGLPPSLVLGSMVAHEVGHLLLGDDSHSPDGLMQGEWRARDFLAVLRGESAFTREQSERMRSRIAQEFLTAKKLEPGLCEQLCSN